MIARVGKTINGHCGQAWGARFWGGGIVDAQWGKCQVILQLEGLGLVLGSKVLGEISLFHTISTISTKITTILGSLPSLPETPNPAQSSQ